MILHASNGCCLTQSSDVPIKERLFRTHVSLSHLSELGKWKEIPLTEKERMLAESAVIDMDNIDYDSIQKVDTIIEKISGRINSVPMNVEQSLAVKTYFPKWEKLENQTLSIGFKTLFNGTLYEVIQEHTVQSDWNPKDSVSLYKVVQIEASGTIESPIEWKSGMELEEGKYYMELENKYLCIRSSGIPLHYLLSDLAGSYVELITENIV